MYFSYSTDTVKKTMDVFLAKNLAEDYIKKQDTPDSFYIVEKFIY